MFKTKLIFDNFPLSTYFLDIHKTKSSQSKCIKYYIHLSALMQSLKENRPVVVKKIKFKVSIHIDSVLNIV